MRAEAEPLQPGKGVVRHMRNLERLILRPLNARGHSAALVQAPRTDADMRAEMAELAGAVSASKGAQAPTMQKQWETVRVRSECTA